MNEALKNFSINPTNISIPRTKQKMRHSHKTTYNVGELIPIYWREVLPGSTVKMNVAEITRMQTPIFPIMDSAFQDTMFFFVPNRLIWDHWEEFMGENKTGYWEQPIQYQVPQIKFDTDATVTASGAPSWYKGTKWYKKQVLTGSLADYMGIPVSDPNTTTPTSRSEFEVNALPFRAYFQVFNDWWRDENLMLPIDFDKGDADITAEIGGADPEAALTLVPPHQVAKFHDYFTTALPQPQKHNDVILPVGVSAPVIGTGMCVGLTDGTDNAGLGTSSAGVLTGNKVSYGKDVGETLGTGALANLKTVGVVEDPDKSGLIADLSSAQGVSINELRQAFAIQRFYEKQARGGSRYIEQLKSMFGVTSPDARLQRSEYLGGIRRPINIDQVVQTSATTTVTPQGNVSAYSLTGMNEELFTKSFVEHGILIGVQVIRLEHSYQDGINKMWLRKSMFDYYNPTFANLGEMPIYNKEIYAGTANDDEAFGYQEAWAEYRYMNNRVSGEFRSKYFQTLDAWHFADNYYSLPSLSFAWLEEDRFFMDRNLAVSSRLANQFMSDIFFEETWTQPMPTYSVPGLIDHY